MRSVLYAGRLPKCNKAKIDLGCDKVGGPIWNLG